MTPPPTFIDGQEITGATIDGQEVQEITIDGQTVFGGIPDAGMDNVYFATNIDNLATWPDEVGNVDLNSVGSVSLDSNGINGNQAFDAKPSEGFYETDGTWDTGSNNEFTVACVFQLNDTDARQRFAIGDNGFRWGVDEGQYEIRDSNSVDGTTDTNPHVAVGTLINNTYFMDIDGVTEVQHSNFIVSSFDTRFDIASQGGSSELDGLMAYHAFEASGADSSRRDEITSELGQFYGINVS
jgi:hypothetical protein